MDRRDFLIKSALGGAVLTVPAISLQAIPLLDNTIKHKPIVISTWRHGLVANTKAWKSLSVGGYSLDAVEAGVRTAEDDPTNRSVGYGGAPDREGKVTLDACIQKEDGDCGAVTFVQQIKNPISLARKVMEESPHVMLSGKGAEQFAKEQGFEKIDLLTEKSMDRWQEWLEKSQYNPVINTENHDTIGMLALDSAGRLCGACTTSGAAYKMHGRVGDSPIIGAGLFVDNEVGAACATGLGEEVIKVAGSAMIVELMRHGASPQDACKEVIRRIEKRAGKEAQNFQVGFIALNMQGEYGSYSLKKGFNYACSYESYHELIDSKYLIG